MDRSFHMLSKHKYHLFISIYKSHHGCDSSARFGSSSALGGEPQKNAFLLNCHLQSNPIDFLKCSIDLYDTPAEMVQAEMRWDSGLSQTAAVLLTGSKNHRVNQRRKWRAGCLTHISIAAVRTYGASGNSKTQNSLKLEPLFGHYCCLITNRVQAQKQFCDA